MVAADNSLGLDQLELADNVAAELFLATRDAIPYPYRVPATCPEYMTPSESGYDPTSESGSVKPTHQPTNYTSYPHVLHGLVQ
jgi:hypothetical protein